MSETKSFDCIRLENVTTTFSAIIGNVQTFYENTIPKTKVLLRDVTSIDSSIEFKKVWMSKAAMVKLAKNNLNKKIMFEATCERTIYKASKTPEIFIKWIGISNVRLED